jgi:hypothetical protein
MSISLASSLSEIFLKAWSDDARPKRVAFCRQVHSVKPEEVSWRRLAGRKQRRGYVDVAESGIAPANCRNLRIGLPVLGPRRNRDSARIGVPCLAAACPTDGLKSYPQKRWSAREAGDRGRSSRISQCRLRRTPDSCSPLCTRCARVDRRATQGTPMPKQQLPRTVFEVSLDYYIR